MLAILAAAALAAAPADLVQVRVDVRNLDAETARTAIFDAARKVCAIASDFGQYHECVSRSAAAGMRQYQSRPAQRPLALERP